MENYDKNYDLIIIGGGAAGCFAASLLSGSDLKVLLIERTPRLMQKLAITGKGRCNLTNNCDIETVFRNIHRNAVFMRSALSNFSPSDTINYFEGLGVPLKTERGNRVFPASDKSADIVNALKNKINASNIEIVSGRVAELIIENNAIKGVKCLNRDYYGEKVLLATGGVSYPKTGSTGDGYALAKKAGHTIMSLKPALVALETIEDYSSCAGLTLKNVRLDLKLLLGETEKFLYSGFGEALFTHFGISGPLALSASSYIDDPLREDYAIFLDLKPALNEKKLDSRLLHDFSEKKNRLFKNSLDDLLPEKLISIIIARSGIDPDKRVNEITKNERKTLLSLFTRFEIKIKDFRPIEEAIITDGGISVKEINPKTMESKLIKNLYFAGEVIDVTGFTGGFNLQIAFSTAYTAIKDISANIDIL